MADSHYVGRVLTLIAKDPTERYMQNTHRMAGTKFKGDGRKSVKNKLAMLATTHFVYVLILWSLILL